MISHKYKCIFVHIQRAAGTSIERWLVGQNWWLVKPETKHLLASQAKALYKDYWNDYFKFSFVRNPWDRMVSMLKHADHFGIKHSWKGFDFSGYLTKHGQPITLEYDYRFYQYDDLLSKKHQPNSIYGNILDEELDFIGRFENLAEDTNFLRKKLSVKEPFNFHEDKSKRKHYKKYFRPRSRKFVEKLHQKDLEEFGYSF